MRDADEMLDVLTIPRGDLGGRYRLRQELGDLSNDPTIRAALLAAATYGALSVQSQLGFVGGARYCPGCMREFHADYGQHEPGCAVLADIMAEHPDGL